MIVDHDARLRFVLAAGFEPLQAANGREALLIAAASLMSS